MAENDDRATAVELLPTYARLRRVGGAVLLALGVTMVVGAVRTGDLGFMGLVAGPFNILLGAGALLLTAARLRLDAEGVHLRTMAGPAQHVAIDQARVEVDPDDDVPLLITVPDQAKPLVIDPRVWAPHDEPVHAVVRAWATSHGVEVTESPEPAVLRRRHNRATAWTFVAVLAVGLVVATVVGQLA